MSERVRGQEVLIQITRDGQPLGGSFVKVLNFRLTPRDEITEENFLGEQEADLDYRFDGVTFTFDVHNTDGRTLRFFQERVDRQRNRQRLPSLVFTFTQFYRETEGASTLVLRNPVIRMNEHGAGSRTDYLVTSFEGKAKTTKLTEEN
jgi:hypothetical protein